MANRDPGKCSKAVREAWDKERDLVIEGKGTRDWTPEQQEDILAGYRPKDEQGRTYEGHHMLSAEAHPEFQDDPENIQFLTRDEHQAAHNNSFQNETHGWYDPETGETLESGHVVSAPEYDLSDPVMTDDEGEQESEDAAATETRSEGEGESEGEDVGESKGSSIHI